MGESQLETKFGNGTAFTFTEASGPGTTRAFFSYPESGYMLDINMRTTETERSNVLVDLSNNYWIDWQTRVVIVSITMYNPHAEFIITVNFVVHGFGYNVFFQESQYFLFYYGIYGPLSEKLLGIFLLLTCLAMLGLQIYFMIYKEKKRWEEDEAVPQAKSKTKKDHVRCNCPSFLKIFNVFRVPELLDVICIDRRVFMLSVHKHSCGADQPAAEGDIRAGHEGPIDTG